VDFAASLGLSRGVTGYAYHSVPVALYAFLLQPNDFRAALEPALNCGGDTDTVGAITGALCGAVVGEQGIPKEWVTGICDWPRSISLLRRVSERLAAQKSSNSRALGPVPKVVIRIF
jgi:ADP-ribosylglycohydrolase